MLLACAPAMLALHAAGVRYNATPSVPEGWYVGVGEGGKAGVGDYVAFCPPVSDRKPFLPPGGCSGGNAPLIKQVVAAEGDVVEVSWGAVKVNGKPLPASAVRNAPGLPHAFGTWKIGRGQVWAYGSARPAASFDSRYFGPVTPERVVVRLR